MWVFEKLAGAIGREPRPADSEDLSSRQEPLRARKEGWTIFVQLPRQKLFLCSLSYPELPGQHEAASFSPERSAWIGGQGTEP